MEDTSHEEDSIRTGAAVPAGREDSGGGEGGQGEGERAVSPVGGPRAVLDV